MALDWRKLASGEPAEDCVIEDGTPKKNVATVVVVVIDPVVEKKKVEKKVGRIQLPLDFQKKV